MPSLELFGDPRKPMSCLRCGKEVLSRKSPARNRDGSVCDKIFCSRECYDLHRISVRESRAKQCETCGASFIPAGGTSPRFCSWGCRLEAKRGKPIHCLMCNGLFTPVKKIMRGDRVAWISYNPKDGRATCSHECHIQWIKTNPDRKRKISEAFTGELHPNWKGGRSWASNTSYRGSEWEKIAERARRRDGHACQKCGLNRAESEIKFGRELDVHHIVPFHNWPNAKKANRLSNLITLCKSCHRAEEAKCAEVQFTLLLADNNSGQRRGHAWGEKHPSAKLTKIQATRIRERAGKGEFLSDLSKEYGITIGAISALVSGKTWKKLSIGHVPRHSRPRNARAAKGEAAGNVRFTEAQITDIRQRAFDGERLDSIGSDYGLTYHGVYQIVKGKIWKHLPILGYQPHRNHIFHKGSDKPLAKVKEEDVVLIRSRHANGETIVSISADYQLSTTAVANIIHRKTWKHVK